MEEQRFTVHQYLKGKVADYTVSDNVVVSACFDRGIEPGMDAKDIEEKDLQLTYADLLKYIYLQPSTTKSYAVANGTWSQKEGATSLTEEDKERLLRAMRRIYGKYGEPEEIPAANRSTIRVVAHGMKMWKKP